MSECSRVWASFIENIRKGGSPVVIFLINGVKLQGIIDDFDDGSVVLRRDQNVQLICRDAISTVVPQTSPSL